MADERPVILKNWTLISPYLQAVNKLMTISALPLFKYQFASIIEPIFAVQASLSGLTTEGLITLWKRQYGVDFIELEGVGVYATNKGWAFELADVAGNPLYGVGVRCPCRQRDGFGQPFPICPE